MNSFDCYRVAIAGTSQLHNDDKIQCMLNCVKGKQLNGIPTSQSTRVNIDI